MFEPTYALKDYFFDSPKIRAAVNNAERRALSKIGAFIRRRARTDVLKRSAGKGTRASVKRVAGGVARKVQATARPGAPPIVRSKDKVRTVRNILFAYNPTTRSVFVGPVLLNGSRPTNSSADTVVELLEKGGTAGVAQWSPAASNVWSLGNVRRPGVRRRIARGKYAAHPFMGPALERETAAGTIADAFAGSVQ